MTIRVIVLLALAAICTSTGWMVRGWKEDSEDLAVSKAVKIVTDAAAKRESDIAGIVEARLAELQANQTIIDRGIIREIQNPVYRNVCIGDDGVRLLNAAARGEAAGNPTEPAEEVPKAAPTAR